MAVAATRQPAFRVVNSVGNPIEGAYLLAVYPSLAPANLGLTVETIDAWEEEEIVGPWKNFLWQQVSFPLGYRLHANLKFTVVESDLASDFYGLTLLHRLWQIGVNTQLNYAALQFRMFSFSAWHGVVAGGTEWRPTLTVGKQGFYDVEFPITTRELVPLPGDWAKQQW